MSIFKAYDIRGKYPSELNENNSYLIGRAIAKHLNVKKVVVGRDVRTSSDSVKDSLVKGLSEENVAVTDIGIVTTPMSYFANGFCDFPASVMVTASHNPAGYNGFKICREKAIALSEKTGLQDIKKITESIPDKKPDAEKPQVKTLDIKEDYKKFILGLAKNIKPLKIAVDTANGVTGPIFDYIFSDSVFTYERLFFEPDGNFPNHEPNPMKDENLKAIKDKIVSTKADFGIAFDGDGDRCMFLDEKAERIPSDLVSALISKEILAGQNGASILYDLRSSWIVKEEIENSGGKPIRERVGHAFIKDTMRKHNAPFGGEVSGHYYFKKNYFADSGIIAFIHFINAVSRIAKPVSEIFKPLRKYFSSGEINFQVLDKNATMKQIAQTFKDGKIDHLDGVTIEYPDYWFNVRPSNTEPYLRLNLEAKTKEALDAVKEKLIKIIKQ